LLNEKWSDPVTERLAPSHGQNPTVPATFRGKTIQKQQVNTMQKLLLHKNNGKRRQLTGPSSGHEGKFPCSRAYRLKWEKVFLTSTPFWGVMNYTVSPDTA
jgi:hypothetical protein